MCMPINVWCLCDVANVFIKGEIVKSCVMCNIGKCLVDIDLDTLDDMDTCAVIGILYWAEYFANGVMIH